MMFGTPETVVSTSIFVRWLGNSVAQLTLKKMARKLPADDYPSQNLLPKKML